MSSWCLTLYCSCLMSSPLDRKVCLTDNFMVFFGVEMSYHSHHHHRLILKLVYLFHTSFVFFLQSIGGSISANNFMLFLGVEMLIINLFFCWIRYERFIAEKNSDTTKREMSYYHHLNLKIVYLFHAFFLFFL